MKMDDLKGKTPDELSKILIDLKKEQVNQRFQKKAGQLEKQDVVRKTRHDIARVRTQMSLIRLGKEGAVKPAKTAAKKPAKAKKAAA